MSGSQTRNPTWHAPPHSEEPANDPPTPCFSQDRTTAQQPLGTAPQFSSTYSEIWHSKCYSRVSSLTCDHSPCLGSEFAKEKRKPSDSWKPKEKPTACTINKNTEKKKLNLWTQAKNGTNSKPSEPKKQKLKQLLQSLQDWTTNINETMKGTRKPEMLKGQHCFKPSMFSETSTLRWPRFFTEGPCFWPGKPFSWVGDCCFSLRTLCSATQHTIVFWTAHSLTPKSS